MKKRLPQSGHRWQSGCPYIDQSLGNAGLWFPDQGSSSIFRNLRERLIKTGARLVRHARYAIFQMAEVAVPRRVFAAILTMINALLGPPPSEVLT